MMPAKPSKPKALQNQQKTGFDLVVLAGGAASRMGDLCARIPKSMLPVLGAPFISWQIESLKTLCPQLRHVYVIARANDAPAFQAISQTAGLPVTVVPEYAPRGTGGALLDIVNTAGISPLFLAMNGDVLFHATPAALLESARNHGAAMQYISVPDAARFGRVTATPTHITGLAMAAGAGQGDINAGLYAFDAACLRAMPNAAAPVSFENEIAPQLIKAGRMGAVKTHGEFIDIGTPPSYGAADLFCAAFCEANPALVHMLPVPPVRSKNFA